MGAGGENLIAACSNIASPANSCNFAMPQGMVGNSVTLIVRDADARLGAPPPHVDVVTPPVSYSFDVGGTITITAGYPKNGTDAGPTIIANDLLTAVTGQITMNWSANSTSITNFYLYVVDDGAGTILSELNGGAAITTAQLPYTFAIPEKMIGDDGAIKVMDADYPATHPSTEVTSGTTFDVNNAISITAQPVAGGTPTKSINDTLTISWSGPSLSYIPTYDVVYSIDGGGDTQVTGCDNVASTEPADTSCANFVITSDMVGKNVVLKVKDANSANSTSISVASNSFHVAGTIPSISTQPVTNPTGDDVVIGGANLNIAWSDNGRIHNYNVLS